MSRKSCSICGKTLADSKGLWRHKKKYCTALKQGSTGETKLKGTFLSPQKSLELRKVIREMENKHPRVKEISGNKEPANEAFSMKRNKKL